MKSLQEQLTDILSQYGDELKDEVEEAVKVSAKDATKELRAVSDRLHHRSGNYAKGWTVSKIEKTWKGIEVTIYNKNKPGLAHLLNNGHAKRGGGRVSGDQHIDGVETYAQEKLFTEVENKIK